MRYGPTCAPSSGASASRAAVTSSIDRCFQAASGTLVDGNEVFDLKPELGIFAAGLSEERLTLLGRALQRGMEEFLYLTPTLAAP